MNCLKVCALTALLTGLSIVAAAQPAPVVKGSAISDATTSLEILPQAPNAGITVIGPAGQIWNAAGRWYRTELVTGEYKVKVSAPGFESEDYVWKLEPDQKYKIKVELKRPGNLVITGTPKGAKVEITGPGGLNTVQGLPVTIEGAPKGQYSVTVSRNGYQSRTLKTEVVAGENSKLAVKLLREGELSIDWVSSKPAGVEFTRSEVTVSQYSQCIDTEACKKSNHGINTEDAHCNWGYADRGDHPMNCVSWRGASEFCKWAGGRLPTAEEWSAEAGNKNLREYPWGDEALTCDFAVWGDANKDACGANSTWPVCAKPKGNSVSGLCDMSGNVWEWTSTPHDKGYVLCGGSWLSSDADDMDSSARAWDNPAGKSPSQGFRCVRPAR